MSELLNLPPQEDLRPELPSNLQAEYDALAVEALSEQDIATLAEMAEEDSRARAAEIYGIINKPPLTDANGIFKISGEEGPSDEYGGGGNGTRA